MEDTEDNENYIYVIEWLNKYWKWMALDFEYTKIHATTKIKELKNLNPKNHYRIRKYMPISED